jgi:Xaa-Pro aminopeptidase
MHDAGLDAVVASSPANVTYTVGAWIPLPLLDTFVLTTASDEQAVVVNEADAYHLGAYGAVSDVRAYRFGPTSEQQALDHFGDLLREHGLERSVVGIELGFLPLRVHRALVREFPEVDWRDAGGVFEQARVIKTPAEIEILRRACFATEKAMQTGFALVAPGDTEKTLAAEMQGCVLRFGADALLHAHVHAGEHSLIVHTLALEEPIRPGEVIHVDFGAVFAGYTTDLSRNAVVGQPSSAQRDIYAKLYEIHLLTREALVPGVTADEIFRRIEPEFAARGLVHPWATLGHSSGLTIHEGFEIARGSQAVLEPGMVINYEPSHIEPGDARYHIEDTVVITEDGNELLSDFSAADAMFVIA